MLEGWTFLRSDDVKNLLTKTCEDFGIHGHEIYTEGEVIRVCGADELSGETFGPVCQESFGTNRVTPGNQDIQQFIPSHLSVFGGGKSANFVTNRLGAEFTLCLSNE